MPSTVKRRGWLVPGGGGTPPPPPGDGSAAVIRSYSGKGYQVNYPWIAPAGLANGDVLYIAVTAADGSPRTLPGFDVLLDRHRTPSLNGDYWTVLRGRITGTPPANFTLSNGVNTDSGVAIAIEGVGDLAFEDTELVLSVHLTGGTPPTTFPGFTVDQNNTLVLAATLGIGVGPPGNMSSVGIVGWPVVARESSSYAYFYGKELDAGPTGNLQAYPFDDNMFRDIAVFTIEVPPSGSDPGDPPPDPPPGGGGGGTLPTQRGAVTTKGYQAPYPIPAPSGLALNDTVVLTVSNWTGAVPTLPGFTTIQMTANTGYLFVLYGRITGSVPSGFSPTNGSSDDVSHCAAFSGVDTSNIIVGTPYTSAAPGATNPVPIPGVTVGEDNTLLVVPLYSAGTQGASYPAPLSNIAPVPGYYTSIGIGEKDAGPTGTINVTVSNPWGQFMGVVMALPPS
jgi:hypothetical protein